MSVTEHVEKVVDENSEAWSSWVKAGQYNYDSLVQSLGERLAMPMAKLNYALFYGLDEEYICDQTIETSSAGVHGWAEATFDLATVAPP